MLIGLPVRVVKLGTADRVREFSLERSRPRRTVGSAIARRMIRAAGGGATLVVVTRPT